MSDDIYVATSGYSAYYKGDRVSVHAGETARAGHWVVELNPNAWKLQEVDYEGDVKEDKRTRAYRRRQQQEQPAKPAGLKVDQASASESEAPEAPASAE